MKQKNEEKDRARKASRALSKYTNYSVKKPMELMEFLASQMPDASRTKLKSLLSKRVVYVDHVITTQFNFELQPGMTVQISKNKGKKEFQSSFLKIVFEDEFLIVVDKREGLLSIGTDKQRVRTAHSILSEYVQRSGKQFRLFIVYGLDKDASGLMIFTKDKKTKFAFQDYWDEIIKDRRYVAALAGTIAKDQGTVTSWLSAQDNQVYITESSMPHVNEEEEKVVTHYQTIKRANGYSLVELETSRKNQMRTHLADLRHPILGDVKYAGRENPLGRLAVHAFKLDFYHPVTRVLMEFETPYPASFKKLFLKTVEPNDATEKE